ncbi:ADP-ribose pyrophosphatase [Baekduia alba]|uniref:NUDIX hydrolase n=1 Tax=Baekduia alba TaxID=2997333 RepID=UPI0023408014|nr:NUDIX hydrolase [Baekduia alba]WCB94343.1 ADP-ribose pyrophosphatase [Baekduia alba]
MGHDARTFERIGSQLIHEGRILTVTNDTFRYADGKTAEREIVHTSGAAAVVAVDDEHVWLVRQPREPIDEPDSLEIPAGRLDPGDASPMVTAQRELAEEIGKVADRWTPLTTYWSSVGFTSEAVHLFLAEGLRDAEGEHDSGEDERIEIVRWPLTDLDGLVAQVDDSKTLLGLLLFERLRHR